LQDVDERVCVGEAACRVLLERPHDCCLELGRHGGVEVGGRDRPLVDVLHRHAHRGIAPEWQPPGDKLVENDPDRVEVRRGADRSALGLLGRQVVDAAEDRAVLGEVGCARAGYSEVGQLQPVRAVDDRVMGLQVAVHDAHAVDLAGGAQHLHDEVDRARELERRFIPDDGLERAPRDVLHRDVVGARELAAVVDRHDVLVRQACCARRLAPEALYELLIPGEPRVQELDGDLAVQAEVLGAIHACGSALAKLLAEPVAAVDDARAFRDADHARNAAARSGARPQELTTA
jgi:hypothetical protein